MPESIERLLLAFAFIFMLTLTSLADGSATNLVCICWGWGGLIGSIIKLNYNCSDILLKTMQTLTAIYVEKEMIWKVVNSIVSIKPTFKLRIILICVFGHRSIDFRMKCAIFIFRSLLLSSSFCCLFLNIICPFFMPLVKIVVRCAIKSIN